MKRNILLVFLIILIILLFILGVYKTIGYLEDRSKISHLKEYTFSSNEEVVKSFDYNQYHYVLTKYYDDTSSWSHLNLLLKKKEEYYLLENIKKCDIDDKGSNLYIKDNEVYIHCIGKDGNIDKYLISNLNIEKETLIFDYESTPNISQLHIVIDKVDKENIYLSSPFKVDSTVDAEPKVKCSFEDKICRYE